MNLKPSPWVQRWSHLVPVAGRVLDVACGTGRHVSWFVGRGHRVTGVDRDANAVADLVPDAEIVIADIEHGPWPFAGRQFDAVVVTNYLWRPLWATIIDSVAEGGVLIYETFGVANGSVGRPSNPDFLLHPGELLEATRGLHTVAYEDGFLDDPARFVQRIAAVRLCKSGPLPPRHLLAERP